MIPGFRRASSGLRLLQRTLLVSGVSLLVLAVVFNFIYFGGNIIPGGDRAEPVRKYKMSI